MRPRFDFLFCYYESHLRWYYFSSNVPTTYTDGTRWFRDSSIKKEKINVGKNYPIQRWLSWCVYKNL